MGRVKFLIWVVVVLVLAGANFAYTSSSFGHATETQLDARITTAAALVAAQDSSLQAQRSLAVAQAAQYGSVISAFKELRGSAPGNDVLGAWSSAFTSAAAGLGSPGLVAVLNEAGTLLRLQGAEPKSSAGRDPLLSGALSAFPKSAWATVNGASYRLFATPLASNVGAVAVGFAVDDDYAATMAKAAGAAITASLGDKVLGSSVAPAQRTEIAKAARSEGSFSAGHGKVASLGPLALPILVGDLPAVRGRVFPIDGLDGGKIAVSLSVESAYGPLGEYQTRFIPGFALGLVFLCLGFVFAAGGAEGEEHEHIRPLPEVRKTAEPVSSPPPLEPLAAAVSAEEPAPPPEAAHPSEAEALASLPPPPEASPDDFHFGGTGKANVSPPPPPPAPSHQADPFASQGDAFSSPPPPPMSDPFAPPPGAEQPAFPSDPFAAAPSESSARPYESDATVVAQVPEQLLRASARPPPRPMAAAPVSEETHFQDVYREFIATRERCGEPADGLTYEKFAAKLRKNKDQLIAKYNCKTVRFQVYVKDGKAALKATPVKE